MTQYLVATRHPSDCDPSLKDEAMGRNIDALNDELVAARDRGCVGGLEWPPLSAKSLRVQPDGDVLITDRPYLETEGHVGGLWRWNRLSWTRRWSGALRPPSHFGRRSSSERLTDGGPRKAIERLGRSADRGHLPSRVRPHCGAIGSVGSSPRRCVRPWRALELLRIDRANRTAQRGPNQR
jgi:hypothetical protein